MSPGRWEAAVTTRGSQASTGTRAAWSCCVQAVLPCAAFSTGRLTQWGTRNVFQLEDTSDDLHEQPGEGKARRWGPPTLHRPHKALLGRHCHQVYRRGKWGSEDLVQGHSQG